MIQDVQFLRDLRTICTREGIVLLFDEVISGFRVGFEGAAGYYGIQPDVMAFGKIIGGGMPVGAYASSAEIMSKVAPDGPVYQAGTLSGNPVAMAAGIAQLKACLEPGFYDNLKSKTDFLVSAINTFAQEKEYAFKIFSVGSIFWLSFGFAESVRSMREINAEEVKRFAPLHAALLEQGVYLGPSGYEVGFVSAAHSMEDLAKTIEAFKSALQTVFA